MAVKKAPTSISPNPFRTCDVNGNPVPTRFSSARDLRDVFNRCKTDDSEDAKRRERIDGMFNGKLPWTPESLAEAGMADKANFNMMELFGLIVSRGSEFANLALDNVDLITISPALSETAGPDSDVIAKTVASEFSTAIREDGSVLLALRSMARECDLFGIGPVAWTDPIGFRPSVLRRGNIKFPGAGPARSSDLELIFVESTLQASYLYQLFDNPAVSESTGWHLDTVKEYIVKTFYEGQSGESEANDEKGLSVIESMAAKLRENRVFETKQMEELHVVHAFVREVGGARKISHYIIPGNVSVHGFLMERTNQYDKMDDCFMWLSADPVQDSAKGVRGVASHLAPVIDHRNRAQCEAADSADLLSRIFITADNTHGAVESATMTESGRFIELPPGYSPARAPLDPQGLVVGSQIVSSLSSECILNISGGAPINVYGSHNNPTADRKTKEEILLEREDRQKASQSLYIDRMLVLDAMMRTVFARFLKQVKVGSTADPLIKRFIDRCKLRGVDPELIQEVSDPVKFTVVFNRDLISGGSSAKANTLTTIIQGVGGSLPEQGLRRAVYDLVECKSGTEAARRYADTQITDMTPTDATSFATLENTALQLGGSAVSSSDQLHFSHIAIHWQILDGIVAAVQGNQVQDAKGALGLMEKVTEHIQSHIAFGARLVGKAETAKGALRRLRSLRPVQQALQTLAATQDRVERAKQEQQQRELEALQQEAAGQKEITKRTKNAQDAALRREDINNRHAERMRAIELRAQADMAEAGKVAAASALAPVPLPEENLNEMVQPTGSTMRMPG